jgi:hypothetical protein
VASEASQKNCQIGYQKYTICLFFSATKMTFANFTIWPLLPSSFA